MKKFIIFLISIIIVVSMGLTTYYFLKNNEVISYNTAEIYCNVGDTITIADLGKKVKRLKKETTYDYNAGGDEVVAFIEFDATCGFYTAKKGGDVTVVIATSNVEYPSFSINVHIGDGSKEFPYYIRTQLELEMIGNGFSADAHFELMNDISLNDFSRPIGYNANKPSASGFGGEFNGNGHTISNVCLSGNYNYAGLFAKLKSTASVHNLYIKDVNLFGKFDYAGALAGVSEGFVNRVFTENVTISNTKNLNVTGGLLGKIDKSAVTQISRVKNVNLIIGETNTASSITATVGGFAGEVTASMVKAVYASGMISIKKASGDFAGLVGKFTIATSSGSIQESYASVTCDNSSYAGFVATVQKDAGFNTSATNYFRYFIGNRAVVGTHKLVKNYDSTLFTSFLDKSNLVYAIVDYPTISAFKADLTYIYYYVSREGDAVMWDNCWIETAELPELSMTSGDVTVVSNQYFVNHVTDPSIIHNTAEFMAFINTCRNSTAKAIKDKTFQLQLASGDFIDLTSINWQPIAMINSVFDGNDFEIRGLNISSAENGDAGLFSYLDHSTVKNLTISNVCVNTSATNCGAVAGTMKSLDKEQTSEVENVNVNYISSINYSFTNFGGIVGLITNGAQIKNSTVNNLNISKSSSTTTIGGIVGFIEYDGIVYARVLNSQINSSVLYGLNNIGGVAGVNDGELYNVSGLVTIYFVAVGYEANVGGIAGINNKTISASSMSTKIFIDGATKILNIGGVTGVNNGTISNVVVSGSGVAIDPLKVTAETMFIGGIVAVNNAEITNSQCNFANIGTLSGSLVGKNYYVGGIAAKMSNGKSLIKRCIVSSNIYGNYVGGIVAVISDANACVDQVLVGKYNAVTNKIEDVLITGDKCVAGAAYDMTAGTIKNAQVVAQVKGYNNNSICSVITLIFKKGAFLNNSTFDCSLNGNGKFYKETWVDYYDTDSSLYNTEYNILAGSSRVGIMRSVAINLDKVKSFGKTYTESFLKGIFEVEDSAKCDYKDMSEKEFRNSANFRGSYTAKATTYGSLFGDVKLADHKFSGDMTFDMSSTWVGYQGITLTFVYQTYFI